MARGPAEDHYVPKIPGLRYFMDVHWSADQLTAFFRRLDGCTGAGAPIAVRGENPARESFVRWSCSNGPVILGAVQGGQHMLYPRPPPAPTLWWFSAPLCR